jgi:hypothetical protein
MTPEVGITDAKLHACKQLDRCGDRSDLTLASLHMRALHEELNEFFEIEKQVNGPMASFNWR